MAQIRGITIELSADASGVTKALKKTNTEIRGTQKQLSDVNRLLKLDPKNTELVRQKQQLLKKATGETKDKLKELQQAEKDLKNSGVDKHSEQYMAVRREIIATKNSLKEYSGEAERQAKAQQALANVGKGIAVGAAATVAGAVAAGKAVVDLANNTAAYADEVDKASIRMGVSAEYYQEIAYAAGQSGVEVSTLEKAAKKLEGTGVGFEEAMRQVMSFSTAEERAAKASELFGNSVAYQMSPLIEQSGEDFDELIQRANDLGLVLSGDDVKAGVKLGDTMADVNKSFQAIFTRVGAKLLPIVQTLADKLLTFIPKVATAIEKLSPILERIFDDIMPVIEAMLDEVFPLLVGFLENIAPLIGDLIAEALPILVELIQMILPFLIQAAEEILPVVFEIIQKLLPVIEKLLPILQPILKLVLDLLGPLMQIIDECLMPIIDLILTGVIWALEKLAPVVEWIGEVFGKVFSKLPEVFKGAMNGIIRFLNWCVDGINKLLKPIMSVVETVGSWFGASWDLGNIQIPHIPLLASGGVVSGGSAIVGEAGPELLTVAGGKSIVQPLTNNNTKNYNSSLGGVVINITQTDGESSAALADRISQTLAAQYERTRAVYA